MTTPGLTNPLSLEEVREWVNYWQHPGWENEHQVAQQLVATMQREAKLREMLVSVLQHYTFENEDGTTCIAGPAFALDIQELLSGEASNG